MDEKSLELPISLLPIKNGKLARNTSFFSTDFLIEIKRPGRASGARYSTTNG